MGEQGETTLVGSRRNTVLEGDDLENIRRVKPFQTQSLPVQNLYIIHSCLSKRPPCHRDCAFSREEKSWLGTATTAKRKTTIRERATPRGEKINRNGNHPDSCQPGNGIYKKQKVGIRKTKPTGLMTAIS